MERMCLEPVVHNKRRQYNEKPMHGCTTTKKEPPPAATRESPHTAVKTQHSQKERY